MKVESRARGLKLQIQKLRWSFHFLSQERDISSNQSWRTRVKRPLTCSDPSQRTTSESNQPPFTKPHFCSNRTRLFSVFKNLKRAVYKVRRNEYRRVLEGGAESLKQTKLLWLRGSLVDGDQSLNFEQHLNRELKTVNA